MPHPRLVQLNSAFPRPLQGKGGIRFQAVAAISVLVTALHSALPTPAAPADIAASLRGKILDMHCHTAGIGAGKSGCFVSPKLRDSYKYKIYLHAFDVTEKELMANGDALVIQKIAAKLAASQYVKAAVILAFDGAVKRDGNLDSGLTQIYVPNNFVSAEVLKYPNLRFGASVNPYRKNALKLLREVHKDGAVLIKWIPSIQHINPADEALIPFYRMMKSLGLPLLTHTGKEGSFVHASDDLSDPARLDLPLRMGVTVIAAHVGTLGKSQGEDNMERLMAMFPRYPNLYADISSLTQINKKSLLGKILARKEIEGRLLYGTDMPLLETPLVSPFYFSLDLSFQQARVLARIKNPWDQDVLLKAAMGVKPDIFLRSAELLRIDLGPTIPAHIDLIQ